MGDEDTSATSLEAYIEQLHIAIYGVNVDKKDESEIPPEPEQLPDDQQTLASVTNQIEYYLIHHMKYVYGKIPNKRWSLLGDLVKREENRRSEDIDGTKWISLRLNEHGFRKKIKKLKEIGVLEQNYSPTFSKVMAESLNGLMENWDALIRYILSDGMNRIGKLNHHPYSARYDKFISSCAADMTSGVEVSSDHRYASNQTFDWKWIRVAKTFKSSIRNFVKFALILIMMFLSPSAAAGYDPEGYRSPAAFLLGDFQPVVEETVHLPVMGYGCGIILTISAKPNSVDSNLKMDKLGYVFFEFKHPNFEDECQMPLLLLQNDVFMPKECTICFSSCINVSKEPFTIVASYNKATVIDVNVEVREGRHDCKPENTSDTPSDAWRILAINFGVLALVLLLLLTILLLVFLFKQYKKTRRSGTQMINDCGRGGFNHQLDDDIPMIETQNTSLRIEDNAMKQEVL